MSVKENPSTTRHRAGSKISETMATIVADAAHCGRGAYDGRPTKPSVLPLASV